MLSDYVYTESSIMTKNRMNMLLFALIYQISFSRNLIRNKNRNNTVFFVKEGVNGFRWHFPILIWAVVVVIVTSLIYNYLCNQCISTLKLWVRTPFMARCHRYNTMW